MPNNVMEPSFEVLRLMPPNRGFLSAELLAIAKKYGSDVFTNIGSCNKLMSVVSDVGVCSNLNDKPEGKKISNHYWAWISAY